MSETTAAQNKAIVQRFYDVVVNQRNVDALPDFMLAAGGGTCGGASIADMVSNPLQPGARLVPARTRTGETKETGQAELDALRDFTSHVLSAFPDMLVKIESMVAEGDTVVVHWSATGTHIGDFLGMPATRRVVPMRSVDYFRIRDGKIASHRGYPDTARVLARLGQLTLSPIARVLAGGGDDEAAEAAEAAANTRPWSD